MTVAAAIEQLFAKNNVTYNIIEAHPGAAQVATAKTIILGDNQGKLQLLLASDSILDIDALRHFTNRELHPIKPADEQAICSQQQLQRLPTIPQVLGMEMLIDSRLLKLAEHKLDSGNEQNIINLNNDQLQRLIANSVVADFTVAESSLQSGSLDDSLDIDQITTAVANFTQLRIKQRLQETLEFPPLPDTAQRIIKLRVNPNADIKDLTSIVESDPALAAQVVSWAASPYYAAPGKIKSVHDAIVRVLGFDLVLNLSLGLALGKTLNMPKDAAKGFTPYWQQAVYAATAVEALVGVIPPKERPAMGMAYLSGLLHNFGYLILAEVFPPHFSAVCRYQEANPYSSHTYIERHLLGVTREQLGAWLMRSWNMPEEVCTALRFQNEGDYQGEQSAYANLLFIAMRLLRQHGIGDAPSAPIPEALFERLHLDRDKANEVISDMIDAAADLNVMAANMAA